MKGIDGIYINQNWQADPVDEDEAITIHWSGCGCCADSTYHSVDDEEARKDILDYIHNMERATQELREFLQQTAK